ncbi:MAG: shikimate kinase [Cytophagales bacterium]|nr:shikimate kinase [Cytophagales bacterium]
MKDKIYLWGMPGSGKSTLGRPLAEALGLLFMDLDEEIERKEGKTIPDIFSEKGEAYFRSIEQKTLLELMQAKDSFLLSTGGGTPCFFDNASQMKADGLTIYLEVTPQELSRRLCAKGLKSRPIFSRTEHEDVLTEIREKLQSRKPFYERADLKVKNDQADAASLAELIDNQKG